ncbi:hypothetical protein ROZALSC1DRAFT_26887 [Rozella allomycis CSF55]|uniref:Uncharacterized protein n=1 Tax=Rozella allomycis (strain CSF55) TaxID=988480 RepID=A0A075B0A6_ROZAC|nr:hypothetical protein O9G_005556 [Rozella allomycis CSF55]RKP21725.1 hypothetical protein ROZALSC1DRAFT_26887 [Rozella allomycis CSF55]|eukprot:EPZ35955.1 hypothetical protein O9G_005556 [Rozella allomycis CSF55]
MVFLNYYPFETPSIENTYGYYDDSGRVVISVQFEYFTNYGQFYKGVMLNHITISSFVEITGCNGTFSGSWNDMRTINIISNENFLNCSNSSATLKFVNVMNMEHLSPPTNMTVNIPIQYASINSFPSNITMWKVFNPLAKTYVGSHMTWDIHFDNPVDISSGLLYDNGNMTSVFNFQWITSSYYGIWVTPKIFSIYLTSENYYNANLPSLENQLIISNFPVLLLNGTWYYFNGTINLAGESPAQELTIKKPFIVNNPNTNYPYLSNCILAYVSETNYFSVDTSKLLIYNVSESLYSTYLENDANGLYLRFQFSPEIPSSLLNTTIVVNIKSGFIPSFSHSRTGIDRYYNVSNVFNRCK